MPFVTHMSSLYTLSRSFPFKSALINVGPRAGTRYNTATNANIENPIAEYKAGNAGTGFIRGLNTNHDAMDASAIVTKLEGNGRGDTIFLQNKSLKVLKSRNTVSKS